MTMRKHEKYLQYLCECATKWASLKGHTMQFSVWIDGQTAHVSCSGIECAIHILPDKHNRETGTVGAFDECENVLFCRDVTDGSPRLYYPHDNEVRTQSGLEMAFEKIEDYISLKLTGLYADGNPRF